MTGASAAPADSLRAVTSLALALLACSGNAERDPSATSAATSASAGAGAAPSGPAGSGASPTASGGDGGAGGAGNGGGTAAGGGEGDIHYRAYNLITGVPRFVLTKRDNDRDICFQLRTVMTASESGTFMQPGPPFEEILVMPGAVLCGDTGGTAPSAPSPSAVAASDADGTIAVSAPPCTVTASFELAFEDSAPWVPATEPFDLQAFPIEQGCP